MKICELFIMVSSLSPTCLHQTWWSTPKSSHKNIKNELRYIEAMQRAGHFSLCKNQDNDKLLNDLFNKKQQTIKELLIFLILLLFSSLTKLFI